MRDTWPFRHRTTALLLPGFLLSACAAAMAAPEHDFAVERGGADPVEARVLLASAQVPQFSMPARLLIALDRSDPIPGCATADLLDLRASSDSGRLVALSVPPSLPAERTYPAADGVVVIHYTTDRSTLDSVPPADLDHNDVPDYVERIGEGFVETLRLAVGSGFPVGFTPAAPLDVYLSNLSGRTDAYVLPRPAPGGGTGFAVIESHVPGDDLSLRRLAAHQAAHALLIQLDPDEPSWWHEASAIWFELLVQHDNVRFASLASRMLGRGERGLLDPDSVKDGGALLWLGYLVESSGGRMETLRQIWEREAAVEGDNLLDATGQVLRTQGRTLAGAFSEFTIWNLFTGERDDGMHYTNGFMLSGPSFLASYDTYPAIAIPAQRTVGPLGYAVIRLEPETARGGIVLTVDGDEAGTWEVDLLLSTRYAPRTVRRIPMPPDGSGRATLGAPWDDAGEALLVVRNMRTDGPAAAFSYTVRSDPGFPYELASLAAEPEGDQVRLVWETESEDSLYGWEIYRSEDRGPFTRVSDVAIPAIGVQDGAVTYQFLDRRVREGSSYQYYVLGVTIEGLTQRSFVVTTRLPR